MELLKIALSFISLAWAIGRATVGSASIVAQSATSCRLDLRLVSTHLNDWRAVITIAPRKLEFRNGQGLQYRFKTRLTRLGFGAHESQEPFNPAGKFVKRDRDIVTNIQHLNPAWLDEREPEWEIEIWAEMGPRQKRLYKGHPTRVQIHR